MTGRGGLTGALAVATVTGLALALAGCGAASPSLTRLRKEATRICTRALSQGARIQPPPAVTATATFLRRGTDVLRQELAALGALRPPAELAPAYAAALDVERRELGVLSATVGELDRGADPVSTIKTLQRRLAPLETKGAAAWQTLDVPACVNQ
jgi:hypothetical protein